MPHIIIKMHLGRTEDEKLAMTEAVIASVSRILGLDATNTSLAIEEVARADWMKQVYEPDIAGRESHLMKRPGYGPLA